MRRKKLRSVLGSLVLVLMPEGSHREPRRGERKGDDGALGPWAVSAQY